MEKNEHRHKPVGSHQVYKYTYNLSQERRGQEAERIFEDNGLNTLELDENQQSLYWTAVQWTPSRKNSERPTARHLVKLSKDKYKE